MFPLSFAFGQEIIECYTNADDEVFTIVQEMPYFGECNDTIESCFKKNFFPYVEKNLIYPENKPNGVLKIRTYMKFIVKQNGIVESISIAKSSGYLAYDSAAIRVIESLPVFTPGKQRGKAVNVQYLVPIDFKFEEEAEVYTIVEKMPLFGTCEEQKTDERFTNYYKEASKCSNRNIETYLQKAVYKIRNQLPPGFFNTQIQFIVETDGSLSNEKIKISSGNEAIDNAALEIVKNMENWQAGSQRGKAVRVQYMIPVIFK